MTSFINLLSTVVWSEADILARVRSVTEAHVSKIRQAELQMIYLGHITQQRTATDDELLEIQMLKQLTEDGSVAAADARADMALLSAAMAYEASVARLALQPGEVDLTERNAAQSVIDGASVEVLALVALRTPTPAPEVSQ